MERHLAKNRTFARVRRSFLDVIFSSLRHHRLPDLSPNCRGPKVWVSYILQEGGLAIRVASRIRPRPKHKNGCSIV